MSLPAVLPDVEEVNADLEDLSLELHPSECHGQLCGMLCGQPDTALVVWLGRLAAQNERTSDTAIDLTDADRSALAALFRATREQLQDIDYGFSLLLPDDEVPFAARSFALSSWCRGFLFGLAMGGVTEGDKLSSDVQEVLQDMSEISRLDTEDAAGDDEEEAAFVELEEYVRVGVLLIWTELQRGDEEPPPPKLH